MTRSTDATPASSTITASTSRRPTRCRCEVMAVKGRTRLAARRLAFPPALVLLACLAGCGSGSSVKAPEIGPARTFNLVDFHPAGPVAAGKATTVSFTIQQPSGRPLTTFKRGAGPHTGVHL